MAGKRKRKRPAPVQGAAADQGDSHNKEAENTPIIKSALLLQYYPRVLTLRQYMLSKLPANSKIRTKKICKIGKNPPPNKEAEEYTFSTFLDQTLVGVTQGADTSEDERWKQWTSFSQKTEGSESTLANLSGLGVFSQSEIVDFVILQLFSRNNRTNGKNLHLLSQGFRREVGVRNQGASSIPGIASHYPNSHVTSMKSMPWPRVLVLLGSEGERAMIDLLLDCAIFVPVASSQGVYNQLSGIPLWELKVLPPSVIVPQKTGAVKTAPINLKHRAPAAITFVRNRMLYAQAAFNSKGGICFGLRHIHVLNRYTLTTCPGMERQAQEIMPNEAQESTIHIMMYIFPRQFGLHNVFTSAVDTRQTAQPFQDYTLREDEIRQKFPFTSEVKVPKRLRGTAIALTEKLQIQHSRCAYKKLLDHYCSVSSTNADRMLSIVEAASTPEFAIKTQLSITEAPMINHSTILPTATQRLLDRKQSMMDHATPISMVSAFCIAVMSRLVPQEFWGSGEVQEHNRAIFNRNISRFIEFRRFESVSLHEVAQDLKIRGIHWLGPAENSQQKLSQSNIAKRWEIFNEFVYYLFDSLLIPLIRANFHVTESNVHRYRLFYFRHDVWKSIAEPALAALKVSMFEEVKFENARKILESRDLGFSQVRLLPKENGIRPIMNLRRRTLKKGSTMLGRSINSILAPVYNVLTYETKSEPARMGSTLFSVGELYSRLKTFKSSRDISSTLYFAKLDVKSAFDTIPQAAVVKLMSSIASEDEYRISRHFEIKPGEDFRVDSTSKPVRKWAALAHSVDDLDTFEEELENKLGVGRKNTIFVENVVNQLHDRTVILRLLSEHVKNNMVKIGKKFYRQNEGIPQGSVLSSLLCNYFYADMEAQHLGFLNPEESLLLRLIDDFLLITTNPCHAKMFLQIMHDGVPEYGVKVNSDKTLVNFEATINGKKVERLVGNTKFPYCGSFVDVKTLDITKDRERRKNLAVGDSLTVEYSKTPGKNFHRKVLNSFRIQAHVMFLDTSFNSINTVLSNTHRAFVETAIKTWTYAKCLPSGKQPGTKLMTNTIKDLIDLAFILMKSRGRNGKHKGYQCAISKVQVEWLAMNGFRTVLRRKQSKYVKVLEWLNERIEILNIKERGICLGLRGAIRVDESLQDCKSDMYL